jgi:hypothetical protein
MDGEGAPGVGVVGLGESGVLNQNQYITTHNTIISTIVAPITSPLPPFLTGAAAGASGFAFPPKRLAFIIYCTQILVPQLTDNSDQGPS